MEGEFLGDFSIFNKHLLILIKPIFKAVNGLQSTPCYLFLYKVRRTPAKLEKCYLYFAIIF